LSKAGVIVIIKILTQPAHVQNKGPLSGEGEGGSMRYGLLSMDGIEKTKEVLGVSLGTAAADLAIVNGTVLNVYTGEFMGGLTVAVKAGWIAFVGDGPGDRISADTTVIDAKGKLLVPGFIDGHTHLADMIYPPHEFIRRAAAGGTTTVITETIEPYPIRGYDGIEDFLNSLEHQPIKFFATAPPLASISSKANGILKGDLKKLLKREDVLGLGESYWSSVLGQPDTFLPILKETLLSGRKLEGHTAGARGGKLMAYLSLGISSCHEPIHAEEVLELLRLGIHVMIREGSIRRDLEEIAGIMNAGIDLRRLILVTDGVSPVDLARGGYLEGVVQRAIDLGFDPVDAIRMATLNVAEYFLLDGLIGGIAPGRHADILIIPDPKIIRADMVISRGNVIAINGDLKVSPRKHVFSQASRESIRLLRDMAPADFKIHAPKRRGSMSLRVIEQVTDLVTREFVATVDSVNGEIRADVSRDLLKAAAIDRAKSPGKAFVGLVKGFQLKSGAFGASSAWDTSDIIIVGTNDNDMAACANRIRRLQGGIVVCAQDRVLAELPMPIFGLMSDLTLGEIVERSGEITRALKGLGCPLDDPLRTLVTLTGAAIPFLRICEEGLVDIKTGRSPGLFME
jgi:adenine deaminase